jgi:Rrf2 family protein
VLKLNRKTEYALMALQHLARAERGRFASVHEIAQVTRIPEVLLAKILQRLKRAGVLDSTQGSAGGYALVRDTGSITFFDFLQLFEEQTGLVECVSSHHSACTMHDVCEIRGPLSALNDTILAQLRHLTLTDVLTYDQRVSVSAVSASAGTR